MPAGGTMLVLPIHGRGLFQHTNRISNLRGCVCRMLTAGGIGHLEIQKIKKTLNITYKLWFNLFLKHASYVSVEK